MPVSGGIDQFQRNIVGKNHTIIDLGVIIAQRGDIVSIGNGSVATIGTQSVCIGYNANDNGENFNTIVGPANDVLSEEGVVVGYNNYNHSDHVVAIGARLAYVSGGDRGVMLGSMLHSEGTYTINIGTVNNLYAGARNVFLLGNAINTGQTWRNCLVMGDNIAGGTFDDFTDVVMLGQSITCTASELVSAVIIGARITTANPEAVVAIGSDLGGLTNNSVFLGTTMTNVGDSNVAIGVSIDAGARLNVVVGSACSTGATSTQSVVIGSNNSVSTASPNTTMVGSGLSLGNTSASATVMGNTITVSATNANTVTIGSALILSTTSPSTTLIGHSIVVAASSDRSVVIGASNSTTGAFTKSNLIGNGILWDYGINSTCLGSNITMNGACDYGVVIGSNITFFAGGGDKDQEVVICASPTISPTLIAQNSIHLILIGSNALFVGPNSSESIILGREGQIAWGGTIGSPQTIAIGFQVNIADNASGAVIVGALAGCVADAQYSTVIGFNAHANGKAGIAIGAGAVAQAHYCVIGNGNDDYYLTNLQVMGDDAAPFFEVYGNIPVPRASIDLGLKVWDGWALNQVSCAVVPPIGARLLYIL